MCGEGPTDIAVARRLIETVGAVPGVDLLSPRAPRGKAALDARLPGLKAGARYRRTFVLRDLDHDDSCAGTLRRRLVPDEPPGFCFRIAVRSVEAWLLADRAGFASWFGLPAKSLPASPDDLSNGKDTIRSLLAQSSRRAYRRSPEPQVLGGWLSAFVREAWQPERAACSSGSLGRALIRLRAFCSG